MDIERRIREALDLDRLVLYAQPIVKLDSGDVEQHELLLRMRDGDQLIAPGEFLPQAEDLGLIQEIDRWVIGQAIQMLGSGVDCLEVNLSGKSLADTELPGWIEERLKDAGADPGGLILEITETAAIASMTDATNFAVRLTRLGCRFAIDDFGVAFGSLYYLKHLPVDYLKIDGEFVRGVRSDPADQVIVQAIVQLARGLGIGTIAEFVADAETMDLLRTYGVDFAQGDHVGNPQPAAELLGAAGSP